VKDACLELRKRKGGKKKKKERDMRSGQSTPYFQRRKREGREKAASPLSLKKRVVEEGRERREKRVEYPPD